MDLPKPSYLNNLARDAGKLAMSFYGKAGGDVAAVKDDFSVVTQADQAVEAMIIKRLKCDWPDFGIIGEEGADSPGARMGDDRLDGPFWVIDPIDGTSNFATSVPLWCISIGLVFRGEPILGAIYIPPTDEIYFVDDDGRARWRDEVVTIRPAIQIERATMHVTTSQHMNLKIGWPGRTLILGAVAIDTALVARGVSQAVMARPYLWDVAAAFAILKAAGGDITYLSGAPIDYRALIANSRERAPGYLVAFCDGPTAKIASDACTTLLHPNGPD